MKGHKKEPRKGKDLGGKNAVRVRSNLLKKVMKRSVSMESNSRRAQTEENCKKMQRALMTGLKKKPHWRGPSKGRHNRRRGLKATTIGEKRCKVSLLLISNRGTGKKKNGRPKSTEVERD